MTIIYAATDDQHLIATILPKVAQNNIDSVRLHVTFDSKWDAYPERTAVFTTSKNARPYPVALPQDGVCIIPPEVLVEEAKLFITVKGEKTSGETKSSTKLTVRVLDGTPTVIISDPTPSVYSQLFAKNTELAARLSALEAGTKPSDSEVTGIRTALDGTYYATAGDAVRAQAKGLSNRIDILSTPIEGTGIVYTTAKANNLIDKSRIVQGYYVGTDGKKHDGEQWNITAPISVSGLEEVFFSGGVGLTCFYKADGTLIKYVQEGSEVFVPPNADYLIASILDTYLPTAMISRYKDQGYDNGFATLGKRGYEKGFIKFTVPVNQQQANNSASTNTSSEGTEDYVFVECILSLPITYRPTGAPAKLLMMCHGAGKGVTEWSDQAGYKALVKKFVDRGYAVFDCNGFKNDALGWGFWGHQKGVEAWRKAYQYVVNNYNVENTFSIYAFSMGGLTAMSLALQNFPGIKSIAMGSPVLNLRACWDDPSVRPVLQQLYGLTDEWDSAKVAGSNPYTSILIVEDRKYCPKNLPPIKIWYGGAERYYGVNKQYAIDFVDAVNNSGGRAEYREINGAGHEISYGNNELCNNDYVIFTERYHLPHERM